MKKILVTGVAGFIGFHLALKLIKEGCQVIGIDNINDYYSVDLKFDRLSVLGINKLDVSANNEVDSVLFENFTFIKNDISNFIELENVFKRHQFECVVNLAAQAGVRYSIDNPHAYVQSNLVGFVNVLECCRHHNIEHLIYASSSSVYGLNEKVPFEETDNVDNPISLYAATKKSNELMASTYSHLYKLKTTGLRFFTVYGPYGRPDMAPILFATAISKGETIKVFNEGNMMRDFTYIDDIVEGIYFTIVKNRSTMNEIYNIGCSNPINLMEFISCLEDELKTKAKLEMYPMQPGDVYVTYADTTKLNKDYDYKPKTNLKEGVKRFVEWYNIL